MQKTETKKKTVTLSRKVFMKQFGKKCQTFQLIKTYFFIHLLDNRERDISSTRQIFIPGKQKTYPPGDWILILWETGYPLGKGTFYPQGDGKKFSEKWGILSSG